MAMIELLPVAGLTVLFVIGVVLIAVGAFGTITDGS